MLAAGEMPNPPLREVQAYLDHVRFGVLPYAGGTFEQPTGLMRGMHYVASVIEEKQSKQRKSMMDKLGLNKPKGGGRRRGN